MGGYQLYLRKLLSGERDTEFESPLNPNRCLSYPQYKNIRACVLICLYSLNKQIYKLIMQYNEFGETTVLVWYGWIMI